MSGGDRLQERLARLSPEQREALLDKIRRARQGTATEERAEEPARPEPPVGTRRPPSADRIEPLPRPGLAAGEPDRFPVSFSQLREWILDRFDPGTAAYDIPFGLMLRGRLDLLELFHSIQALVRRHESLRTAFRNGPEDRLVDYPGEPAQVVFPPSLADRLRLPVVDLTGLPEPVRRTETRRLAALHSVTSFDLSRAPLLSVLLVRLAPSADDAADGDGEHLLASNVHHIVSDGWSMGVFARELGALYSALVTGTEPPLPELPIQYADFAAWQRRRLRGAELERLVSYWRQALGGEPPALELPTDRSRPPVKGTAGGVVPLRIGPRSAERLGHQARRSGASQFMALLAITQGLLGRWAGQDEFAVGTYIANRNRHETQGLIGFFINTLVLKAELAGDPMLDELMERVRETTLGAYDHQDLPFEKLLDALDPERDRSRTPLFQVLLLLQNFPGGRLELPGLTLENLSEAREHADYDLSITLSEVPGGGLGGGISYDRALFDRTTIERLGRDLVGMIDAWSEAPERPLYQIPLGSAATRHQVLTEWPTTPAPPWPATTVDELVHRQAAATPDAVALLQDGQDGQDGGDSVTYRQLDERATALAGRLKDAGSLVAVALGSSPDVVVAMLAVMRSGAAYLPLDPAAPAERLSMLLDDSGARWVVTDDRHRERFEKLGARVLEVAEEPPDPIGEIGETMEPHPEAPVYVIYTSGSTGRPKGVVVRHRNLAAYVAAAAERFRLGSDDRVLQTAALTFDTSGEEIWPALTRGGTVVFRDPERAGRAQAPAELLSDVERLGVTLLDLPTAYWHTMMLGSPLDREPPPSLRRVIVGGEAARPDAVAAWQESPFRRVALTNTYGPTEATIVVAWEELGPDSGASRVPLGRPVPGERIVLRDRRGRAVAPGLVGEMWLAGDGVALGYLGRPAATAAAFVPDPDAAALGRPGERAYRSGDLARHRGDGRLDFFGRADRQVKVRGFRIEPGEIETALTSHPKVAEAAVVPRKTGAGAGAHLTLVAYVVGVDGSTPEASEVGELRSFLAGRLPEHMLPAAVVALDALPLTAHGKLDRRALPMPEEEETTTAPFVAPRTPVERAVADAWSGVLGRSRVGLADNFFDLGGDSLLLLQVHGRLRETLAERLGDADLPVMDLFRFPTVEGLAGHLERLADPEGTRGGAARGAGSRTATGDQVARLVERQRRGGRGGGPSVRDDVPTDAIAVVGMACRVPGASSPEELWENLANGVESITFFDREELLAVGVPEEALDDPAYVPARPVIHGFEEMDADFFDINPREAGILDPQHRVFLEVCWEALERAGYSVDGNPGWIGVYAGSSYPFYLQNHIMTRPDIAGTVGFFPILLTNDRDYFATRVAYKLDLRGPALDVQTACSTSLVAAHLACQALLAGQVDLALAGGVRVTLPQVGGYRYQEGGIVSSDGHCRAFDAGANGSIFGDGAGVVVLKRLADAIADGDHVHAVIRGSAMNNDGADKVGYTAPGIRGQAEVITTAQGVAGVDPATVTYVETHGSGTPLGDRIEVAALTEAFRGGGAEEAGFCSIGSIKTNFGHLEAAAGVAGLMKAVLAVERGQIPPSLHCETPNPDIDWASSPFRVATELAPWEPPEGVPRRAGVSSFGVGGTNVHMVLEEAPAVSGQPAVERPPAREPQLLVLSARTPEALEEATDHLAAHLEGVSDAELADVAFTSATGRRSFEHRRALVASSSAEVREILSSRDPKRLWEAAGAAGGGERVVWLFSGVGDQYVGMARDLYRQESVFRDSLDRAAELLRPLLDGVDVRELLHPEDGEDGEDEGNRDDKPDLRRLLGRSAGGGGEETEASRKLRRTLYLQPALAAVELALAALWRSLGVEPSAVVGYSLGEYVAAAVAGVLSEDDALTLVAERARAIEALEEGAMVAVSLSEQEVSERLAAWNGPSRAGELSVAAVNGPHVTVVAGPTEAVDAFEAHLSEHAPEVTRQRLATSHAFHTGMMEPAAGPLAERIAGMELIPPKVPLVTNVTGAFLTSSEATDPDHWRRHLTGPVRFSSGIETLLDEGYRLFVEVGPGLGLGSLVLQHPAAAEAAERGAPPLVVQSLPAVHDRRPEVAHLLGSLGRLWLAGATLGPEPWAAEDRRRVILPTYPFQRRRHWVEPGSIARSGGTAAPTPPAETSSQAERRTAPERPRSVQTRYVAPTPGAEEAVARAWSDVLGVADIGAHDDFFALGGSSLVVPQVLLKVRQHTGAELPVAALLEDPTVAGLARHVEAAEAKGEGAPTAEALDLEAEVVLPPEIVPEGDVVSPREPSNVFLTGATGFLGAFLLDALLGDTDARVYCLVRAASAQEGRDRIRENLEQFRLLGDPGLRERFERRIVPVPGDLEQPLLGLGRERFDELADTLDSILHGGAWVNFTYPYRTLSAINVGGTVEALRLAAHRRTKPFHFVSSISVFAPGSLDGGVAYEDSDLPTTEGLFSGYAESKWVAERIVREAQRRGQPVTIHRPAVVGGSSKTGAGNTRDMAWSIMKGAIQLGMAPQGAGGVDIAPVDYVAAAIVHLMRDPSNLGRAFHFPNPVQGNWDELFPILSELGYDVPLTPYRQWREALLEAERTGEDNALLPFLPLLPPAPPAPDPGAPVSETPPPRPLLGRRDDGTNTRWALAGSGVTCPPLGRELLETYVDYFVEIGWMPGAEGVLLRDS